MPFCINDPKKKYKGNEPSPKGLGYCAHSEEVGSIRKGRDNNNWKIEKTYQGIKRWVKQTKKDNKSICSNLAFFYNPKVRKNIRTVYYEENGYIQKLIDYNLLSNIKKKIPPKWIKYPIDKDEIQEYYCGTKEYLDENNKYFLEIDKKFKNCKYYFIRARYGTPFLVYIKEKEIFIYEFLSLKYYISNKYTNYYKWMYTNFLKKYTFDKIFIGKNSYNDKYKKNFDGNSILIKNNEQDNIYTFIGYEIYQFILEKDDIIIEYHSNINECPIPIAISKKYIFSFYYKEFINKKYLPDNLDNVILELIFSEKEYKKYIEDLKVKIIKKSNDILYLKDD
jgi:hypothetical protein